MPDHSLFYKHSGRFNPAGVAWSYAGMIGAGLAMGFAYGILAWVIPLIYLVFLGTLGVALGLGFATARLTLLAKTRNTVLIYAGPVLAAAAAVYAAWAGWLFAASDWAYLILNPIEILDVAQNIAVAGIWSAFGITPTGILLYLIWLIEAAILVGGTVFLGGKEPMELPFSERAGRWAVQTTTLPAADALAPETIRQVQQELRRGDLACFGLFQPLTQNASAHTAFRVNWAPGHEDEQFLTISSVTTSYNDKGELQVKTKAIALNMIIDPEARAVIDGILQPADGPDRSTDPQQPDEQSSQIS